MRCNCAEKHTFRIASAERCRRSRFFHAFIVKCRQLKIDFIWNVNNFQMHSSALKLKTCTSDSEIGGGGNRSF